MRIDELVLFSSAPSESDRFITTSFPNLASPGPKNHGATLHHLQDHDAGRQPPSWPAFWKYTVFADSINGVVDRLESASGPNASQPIQFLDIGYLCNLHEPGGHEVELLQRTFSPPLKAPSPTSFGGEDSLGLITLRVTDAAATLALLTAGFGMKRLATMQVDDGRPDPFTLDFLAFTDDEPPETDLGHVANREWLYQRPYTILELQHGPLVDTLASTNVVQTAGMSHISITGPDTDVIRARLDNTDTTVTTEPDGSFRVETTDGHVFRFGQAE